MQGHRKVAVTIYTVLDVSDIPVDKLLLDPFALKDKVDEFVTECHQDFYMYTWEDLGDE